MIRKLSSAAMLLASAVAARSLQAQATPAVTYDAPSTGFTLPDAGQFSYSVTGSDQNYFGYNGVTSGSGASTNAYAAQLGGTVAVVTESEAHPFTLLYGGGGLFFFSSVGRSDYYQSLDVSQAYRTETWNFLVDNVFRILQDNPLGGVSGEAGAGDLGVGTAGGPDATGPLTANQTRYFESVSGNAQRSLTGRTSVVASGSYILLREPGANSNYNSNGLEGSASLSHTYSARDSLTGTYSHFRFNQPSLGQTINSDNVTGTLEHTFSPRLVGLVTAGPQFLSYNASTGARTSISYIAQGSLNYTREFSSFGLRFDHSTRSTLLAGAASEYLTAGGSYSRRFGVYLHGSLSASYLRTSSLPGIATGSYATQAAYIGSQVNRSLGAKWSTYISYTFERQTVGGTPQGPAVLTGNRQILAVGVTFAPRPGSLRRH